MYSVVMMLALSGSAEVPEFGHHRGCSGCYGSCYGCYGGYSCYGCNGCYGGCYGGCHGCYGGHGWRHGHHGYSGCYGCSGCYGYSSYGCCGGYSSCCGGCYGTIVTPVAPATPLPPPVPKEAVSTPATITVQVPAEATIYFDDVKMKTGSNNRVFTTPTLQPNRLYFYTVKAEVERDGQRIATTHQVQFRAGQQVQVSFNMNETGTLTARQD